MNIDKTTLRKAFLLGVPILVLFLVLYFIYDQMVFRVVSINPRSGSEVSDTLDQIVIKFNKTLDESQDFSNVIRMQPRDFFYQDVVVDNKRLIFELGPLRQNTTYTLALEEVRSEDKKIIKDVQLEFTTKYIPFDQLQRDQQERSIKTEESDVYKDPIFSVTPYETTNFSITPVVIDQAGDNPEPESILLRIHIKLSNASTRADRRNYQKEATEYLRSKGVKLSDYIIDYSYDEVFGSAE